MALIDQTFDLPRIARTVLGKHAASAPQEQQARLAHVLGMRMAQQVLRVRPTADDGFAIVETRSLGNSEWLVLTRSVSPPNADRASAAREPLVLGWRVVGTGTAGRIVDLRRDGVSASITQRDDFAVALNKLGLEGAIAEWERRAALPVQER